MRDILQNRYQITQMLVSKTTKWYLDIWNNIDIPALKCPNTIGLGNGDHWTKGNPSSSSPINFQVINVCLDGGFKSHACSIDHPTRRFGRWISFSKGWVPGSSRCLWREYDSPLGGGFKYLFLGMIQFDEHIFQMGGSTTNEFRFRNYIDIDDAPNVTGTYSETLIP